MIETVAIILSLPYGKPFPCYVSVGNKKYKAVLADDPMMPVARLVYNTYDSSFVAASSGEKIRVEVDGDLPVYFPFDHIRIYDPGYRRHYRTELEFAFNELNRYQKPR